MKTWLFFQGRSFVALGCDLLCHYEVCYLQRSISGTVLLSFSILNHFRNHDLIYSTYLILHSMEDCVFKDMKKKEGNKPFYIIYQGFMYKLYKHHLSLNPPLLVNPLTTITPHISTDPSHKKP